MKALIICTSTDTFPAKGTKTGFWFGELAHFYDVVTKKQIEIDIASPRGGEIPVDPRSLDSKDDLVKRYLQDEGFTGLIKNTLALDTVDPLGYRVAYLVGGHGAMWDFPDNMNLQRVVAAIYLNYGTITAIGHGVSGLLNIRQADGSWFVKDRYLTGFSNMEEKLASFSSETPFYLEDSLLEKGANFTKTMIPFTEHIEMDERIITGQNPNSARKVAQKLIEELWEK